jgi:hypothetical protein
MSVKIPALVALIWIDIWWRFRRRSLSVHSLICTHQLFDWNHSMELLRWILLECIQFIIHGKRFASTSCTSVRLVDRSTALIVLQEIAVCSLHCFQSVARCTLCLLASCFKWQMFVFAFQADRTQGEFYVNTIAMIGASMGCILLFCPLKGKRHKVDLKNVFKKCLKNRWKIELTLQLIDCLLLLFSQRDSATAL